jgi:hypothetical protein
MNNIQKRFVFFSICILVRTILAFIAYYVNINYTYYLSFPTFIIGIGFITIYLGNLRTTGREVLGNKIWWNQLRPIHAINYLVFAYLAYRKNKKAYVPLAIDVIIGIVAFLIFHYNSGNFRLLLR